MMRFLFSIPTWKPINGHHIKFSPNEKQKKSHLYSTNSQANDSKIHFGRVFREDNTLSA